MVEVITCSDGKQPVLFTLLTLDRFKAVLTFKVAFLQLSI